MYFEKKSADDNKSMKKYPACKDFREEYSEIENIYCIGATTRDFQQCGILTSVDSGKPVQHPFKLRNSE